MTRRINRNNNSAVVTDTALMPVNTAPSVTSSWLGRLLHGSSGQAPPKVGLPTPRVPQLNSGKTPLSYLDGTDGVRPPSMAGNVAAPSGKAPTPSDSGTSVGRAVGATVKIAGTLGGMGLLALGGMKVLAAMSAATLSLPAFATGVGIFFAGAAAIKLAGIIGKAIRGA